MSDSNFDPSDAVEFWDMTNRQDWHVNALTQQGLRSRAYRPGPYSNAEGLLGAFDRHYLHVMGALP
jgi:Rieske 2Fe-2S family protein